MAETFLTQLPDDKICMVCKEKLGTAPLDSISARGGSSASTLRSYLRFACLSSWLSPNLYRNSCPYCRHELLPATVRLDEDELEAVRLRFRASDEFESIVDTLSRVGASTEVIQSWQVRFDEWAVAGHYANGASVERARGELLARTGWFEMPSAGSHGVILSPDRASNTYF